MSIKKAKEDGQETNFDPRLSNAKPPKAHPFSPGNDEVAKPAEEVKPKNPKTHKPEGE